MAERWENNILGFVPKEDWLEVGFNVTRQNDPIDGLFGDEKTDNLVAKWQSIASEYQIPVMAHFHGFDTEANTTFRVPIDNHNIEKGLIKVKINQSERMRTLLRSGVQEDGLYDYVINDGVRLADQVFTRSKVAKNELMASGKVTINENGLDLTVDYGVPSDQLNLTLDFGAGAAKDIPAQLQDIVDAADAKGVVLTGLMTARANITKLRQNAAVQKAINGNIGEGILVKNADLAAYLEQEFGIGQIITNDLKYGADAVIVPSCINIILSAAFIVESLWAITIIVFMPFFDIKNLHISSSVCRSSEEVASSSINISGSVYNALARASLCFCP